VPDSPDDAAPADSEPDYRYTLANERTYLAWIRTALGLLAGGVAVRHLVPEFAVGGARTLLAVLCVTLAVIAVQHGYRRWRGVERAMRRGEPLPPNNFLMVFTTAVLLVTLVTGVLVIIG
jgi:putative membrane protein